MTTSLRLTVASILVALVGPGVWWMLRSGADEAETGETAHRSGSAPAAAERIQRPRSATETAEAEPASEEATDEAAQHPQTVTIRVVSDETGAPVAGARVVCHQYVDGEFVDRTFRADDAGAVIVTDMDFHDFIERVKSIAAPGFVRLDGWYPNEQEETATSATVRLTPGIALDGIVVDAASGAPIAGAPVKALKIEREAVCRFGRGPSPFDETTTSADGTFRLDGIPMTESVRIAAAAARHVDAAMEWDPSQARRLRIRLAPASMICGTVRDSAGAPVANVTVYARGPARGASAKSKSDAEGRFELDGLPPACTVDVWAEEDCYPTLRASEIARGIVVSAERPVVEQDLALTVPAQLTVIVRVAGEKPDDLRVKLSFEHGENSGVSGDEGRFTVIVPRPGACTLRVSAGGLTSFESELVMKSGESREITVDLKPGPVMDGIVVDAEGRPVDDARVWANRIDDESGSRTTTTDSLGKFRLVADGDRPLRFEVNAGGFEWLTSAAFEHPPSEVRFVLTKESPSSTGTVEFDVGIPLGDPPPSRVWFGAAATDVQQADVSDTTVTEDLSEDFAAGPFVLVVAATGYAATERRGEIKAGETIDLGEIALDRGVSVRGRVTDRDGRPLAGANVRARVGLAEANPVTWTDDAGAFTLQHVPKEGASIRVLAEGFAPFDVESAGPGVPLAIELAPSR